MDLDSCRSCGNYSPKEMYCHLHLKGIERISSCAVRDLVSVVRCKDCKYYMGSNEKCELVDTRLLFYSTNKRWTEESYCSWGERKDDET